MLWIPYALAASFTITAFGQANAHFKLPGPLLNIYRGATPVLMMLPFAPLIDFPTAWQFYALTAVNGFIVSFSDARIFDATAKFGNGQVQRLLPLVLILVFFVWLPLDMDHTAKLLAHPLLTAGIIAALIIAWVSLFFMTRTRITLDALYYVLPVIFATALIDPVNKLTTRYSHGLSGAASYTLFVSLWVFVFMLPRLAIGRIQASNMLSLRTAGYGTIIGVFVIASSLTKNHAMSYAPNPAFVSAIIFCAGIWATIYARVRGLPDEHNVPAAIVFIFSTIALMLLARMI
ncbi:MAG: hypothetical protein P8Y67_14275 [Alphaproteobacteria bacterium]